MSVGGVLIGGGVAPKLLPVLSGRDFLDAFCDKGRYRELMAELPVDVILDERAGLYGAAVAARQLLSNLA
jgi:glucokinase